MKWLSTTSPNDAYRRGFTLVELLVTIVVLGILAGLAMKLIDAKDKAYLAAMQSDLKNLILAQENYFSDNGQYASGVGQLDYNTSPGVTLLLAGNPASGYTARAMHEIKTDTWCAIFSGDPSPTPVYQPASIEGSVKCAPKIGGLGGRGKP